jgi:transposase
LCGRTKKEVIKPWGVVGAVSLDRGIEVVIPAHQRAKVLRDYDEWLDQEGHLVECFINKIKHFRRIFSCFDKLDRSYLGFLHFVSALIWLR